jgi:RNA polymerase sigma-70 factor (ECF subfamily)
VDGIPEPESVNGVCSSRKEQAPEHGSDLVDRIRRGDADAFETLAREQTPRMFRLAMKLCGRREDAEDLVQETLVRALPALSRFEGRARLSTYLLRAMNNVWRNRLRSRRRSRLVEWFRGGRKGAGDDGESESGWDPPDTGPSAHDRLERLDRAGRIREALTRLEPVRRWTLLLREVEELSYEEIATMTEVPVGTVRSRLARARRDLRRIVGDES